MDNKIAFIFPAFITGFNGREVNTLQECGGELGKLLAEAAGCTGMPLVDFDIVSNNFLDDELKTQYLTYIFSCAFADMLRERGVKAQCGAGYSMGIYAALYFAGAITFAEGLEMIKQAFACIHSTLFPGDYTMGVTGGLEAADVNQLLLKYGKNTRIINSNSPYSFVFSGPKSEITQIIEAAHEEGALQARVMSVTLPYHSPFLNLASVCFKSYVKSCKFQPVKNVLISSVDQRRIQNAYDIKNELVHNIHKPFNWYKTIQHMAAGGASTFIECGAGESLTKINKFIDGQFETYNMKNIIGLINRF